MKTPTAGIRRTLADWRAVIFLAALVLGLPARSSAGLILNAEVQVAVEDNIVGLVSGGGNGGALLSGAELRAAAAAESGQKGLGSGTGPGSGSGNYTGDGSQSPGDLSVTGMFELGGFTNAGERMSFFAKGFAERTDYREYSEYDRTIAGISAGMTASLGDRLLVRLAGFDKVRRYDNDPDRDSTAYGVIIVTKQRILHSLWLRQSAEYETSRAAYRDFSYRGSTGRFGAGYDLTERLLVTAGFGLRSQQYQDASRTVLRTQIASLGVHRELSVHWSAGFAYDRESSAAGTSDAVTRNNILSFSLSYAY